MNGIGEIGFALYITFKNIFICYYLAPQRVKKKCQPCSGPYKGAT